jgi:phosphoribosyl-AMP cyclohydrolase
MRWRRRWRGGRGGVLVAVAAAAVAEGRIVGNVLRVEEVRIDCDQDALWLRCDARGPACHTGARSCFYRRVEGDALLPMTAAP